MIEVAKNAGFCFGVARAVDMVYRELDLGKKCARWVKSFTILKWWRNWLSEEF